jgi:hypothetical protein
MTVGTTVKCRKRFIRAVQLIARAQTHPARVGFLSHVLVVRGLISHDEGQASLANQDLAIFDSVRSRCIQF